MFRDLKARYLATLASPDWEAGLGSILADPPRQAVGPLFSFLLNPEPVVKWRAVTSFGLVVARLAEERMESARIIMRRLMWNLSEESGNLGWGAPEVMGEIMAMHAPLADEFHCILASYVHDEDGREGIFIDHAPLRRGAYWGLGRLAQVRPELVARAAPDLIHAAHRETSPDPQTRGFSIWAVGSLVTSGALAACPELADQAGQALDEARGDDSPLALYRDRVLRDTTVAALAGEGRTTRPT